MAKAKRERRTSIRTLPTDGSLGALDALDALERAEQRNKESAPPEPEREGQPTPRHEDGDA